ncbi:MULTISPECIES: hypothetical protein [Clostridium]|uniref:hypothetical protein n=1 Tax=Clostridium TaxID=1485 RepID=UPI000826909E|nr:MULTISPECIES: hypothetical protein [Clostridium]PJI10510.1 hypothetical protein CUB90_00515 [Clostridium sp. CT7]
MYSKYSLPLYLRKNYKNDDLNNDSMSRVPCSTVVLKRICLILNQYAVRWKSSQENSLVYYVYIINNLRHDIFNIKLKDTLPDGVKFANTRIEHGRYKKYNNKIFYYINRIEAFSFCKITICVYPVTLGKKVNSIEVIGEEAKCTVNNPCKVCSKVN